MRSVSKLFAHIALGASLLLAIAVAAAWLLAPVVVERALGRQLAARGFPGARFDVRHVGLRSAVVDGLRIDEAGQLTVASIVASYSPLQLLRGEIETLRITGASWVVGIDGRTIDLGPVDDLFEARGDSSDGEPLRMARIELVDSHVIVDTPTKRSRVPVEGALDRTPGGFVVWMSAAQETLPLRLDADVRQRPRLSVVASLTASGLQGGELQLDGRLASDGRVQVELRGHDWSIDADLDGRRVAADDLYVDGRATLVRDPLELDDLDLEIAAGGLRVDDLRLDALHVQASRAPEGIEVDLDWAAADARGTLAVRGLPTRLTAKRRQDVHFSWRAEVIASRDTGPLTMEARAETHVAYDASQWSVRLHDGRLAMRSRSRSGARGQPRELLVDVGFAGTVARGPGDGEAHTLATTVDLAGSAGTIRAAGMRGTLRRFRLQMDAQTVAGRPDVRGRADVRVAPLVHPDSGLRIDQVSASLPLHYPFSRERSGETGRLRVGRVHFRGATLATASADLVQRGDQVLVSLRLPITPDVTARGRGRIGLTAPLSGDFAISAPAFALEEAEPVVAFLAHAFGGAISGRAAFAAQVGIERGAATQTLKVRLDDVTVSRPSKAQELRGVSGTIALDSVVPPRTAGGQTVRWAGGRAGKLTLGSGHADFALEEGGVLFVEDAATDLGRSVGGGRMSVDAFRWARGEPELRLRVFAESLSLRHWIELVGRDEITGTGKLHGHVSARVTLAPALQLHLGEGELVAEPGGRLELEDVRAAKAVLASAGTLHDVKASMQQMLKQRLIEALQSLQYTTLRFDLVRRQGGVALQVRLAGRGTRGARQEIGGLTINVNHFEDALNELLRLRGGVKAFETNLPQEVPHHAPHDSRP
jgi:hypothetical protein